MTRYASPVRRVQVGRNHVYKDANGQRVPGVTTILGDGVPKKALINWAGNATADYAINNWDELAEMKPAARLAKLQKARYEERDAAANKGTRVHKLAEQLVAGKTVKVPDDLAGHVESYVQFLNDWEPDPVMVEAVVMSHKHGYAGTLDLAALFSIDDLMAADGVAEPITGWSRDDGHAFALVDLKTSRSGIFGETALQLAGYRYADTWLDETTAPPVEKPMPVFDLVLGLHVRADGYDLRPIEAGTEQLRELLYARQVGIFAEVNSKHYVGEPLTPPRLLKRRRLEILKEETA
jgi:hypothetical protein